MNQAAKTLIVILAFSFSINASTPNSETEGDNAPKRFAIYEEVGLRFWNNNNLSQLIYGNGEALKNSRVYANIGLQFRFSWILKLDACISIHRNFLIDEPSATERLWINNSNVNLGILYPLLLGNRLELGPQIGISASAQDIRYTNTSNINSSSTSAYLLGTADTYALTAVRWYVLTGISLLYKPQKSDKNFFPIPVDVGLNVEYVQALAPTRWRNGLYNQIEGPDILTQNFYVGLVFGVSFPN